MRLSVRSTATTPIRARRALIFLDRADRTADRPGDAVRLAHALRVRGFDTREVPPGDAPQLVMAGFLASAEPGELLLVRWASGPEAAPMAVADFGRMAGDTGAAAVLLIVDFGWLIHGGDNASEGAVRWLRVPGDPPVAAAALTVGITPGVARPGTVPSLTALLADALLLPPQDAFPPFEDEWDAGDAPDTARPSPREGWDTAGDGPDVHGEWDMGDHMSPPAPRSSSEVRDRPDRRSGSSPDGAVTIGDLYDVARRRYESLGAGRQVVLFTHGDAERVVAAPRRLTAPAVEPRLAATAARLARAGDPVSSRPAAEIVSRVYDLHLGEDARCLLRRAALLHDDEPLTPELAGLMTGDTSAWHTLAEWGLLGQTGTFAHESVREVGLTRLTPEEVERVPAVLRRGRAEGRRLPPRTPLTADRWTTSDRLGHAVYAEAVAAFIRHPDTRPPLTIGVKGPWGTGKTSLMRMIQDLLDPGAAGGSPARVHLVRRSRSRLPRGQRPRPADGKPGDRSPHPRPWHRLGRREATADERPARYGEAPIPAEAPGGGADATPPWGRDASPAAGARFTFPGGLPPRHTFTDPWSRDLQIGDGALDRLSRRARTAGEPDTARRHNDRPPSQRNDDPWPRRARGPVADTLRQWPSGRTRRTTRHTGDDTADTPQGALRRPPVKEWWSRLALWSRRTRDEAAGAPRGRRGALVTNAEVMARVRRAPGEPREQRAEPMDEAAGRSGWRPTVWFNPWVYQSSEQVWAGLAHEIITQVTRRLPRGERERFWLELNLARVDREAIRRRAYGLALTRLVPLALALGVTVVLTGAAVAAAALSPVFGPALRDAAGVLGSVGPVAVLGAGAVRLAGFFRESANVAFGGLVRQPDLLGPVGAAAGEAVADPGYQSRAGFLHLVQTDIRHVLDLVATEDRPLVVFVDDLDRCSPGTVAQVIEAVNLFLAGGFPNCVFVLAMEPEVVAAHVESAYRDLVEALPEGDRPGLGWRFLEKMVQLPLSMPRLDEDRQVPAYIRALLGLDGRLPAEASDPLSAFTQAVPPGPAAPRPASEVSGREGSRRTPRPAVDEALVERLEWAIRSRDPSPDDLDAITREVQRVEGVVSSPGFTLSPAARMAADRVFNDLYSDENAYRAIEPALHVLALGNPREVKRYLNVYRFYAFLAYRRSLSGGPAVSDAAVAKIAALAVRWPHLVSSLVRDRLGGETALSRLERASPKGGDAFREAVAELGLHESPGVRWECVRALLASFPPVAGAARDLL
ncbi:P-loop NTPase fold protein [Sinosporangium siamense]|nr:P-loop NTPase fold protein [Sinosporangium siamense]